MNKAKEIGSIDPKSCINKIKATIYHKYITPNQKWKKNDQPPANFITYILFHVKPLFFVQLIEINYYLNLSLS
jgi:hypothetical protein